VALLGSTGEVHSFATVLVDGRRVSQDGGKTFAAAETMIVDAGTFIRQPIVTMANGDLLLPVFKCQIAPAKSGRATTTMQGLLLQRRQQNLALL
jgi:predicted neuraminidase